MTATINEAARVKARSSGFIDAPPEQVWSVLSDLRRWPEWNTDVSTMSMDGPLTLGTRFHWKVSGFTINSQLIEVSPPARIAWSGRMVGVNAIHVWHLEAKGSGTEVTTEESFEGLLPTLLPGLMQRMLEKALGQGIQMLKNACERKH